MIGNANWPDDADGDVLRRMQRTGFDFSKPCLIDCNVISESDGAVLGHASRQAGRGRP